MKQRDVQNGARRAFAVAAIITSLSLQNSHAEDWRQWRGPDRDGKSKETGLLKQWPTGGPKLAWKATGLGKGFSDVAVVKHRIYTMGDKGDASFIVALGPDHKVLWSTKVGKPGSVGWGNFVGPRGTPTVDGEMLYAVGQWGDLVCLNAADGKEVWRKNYDSDFGAERPEWGYSESPLIDGDKVIVFPGGSKGAMVALNKKTGEVIWQSSEITDQTQYASTVAASIGGVPQYVQLSMANVVGISPKDGAVLWKAQRKGKTAVIPTPIVDGDFVYVTSGYSVGCNLFKVTGSDGKYAAEEVYANKVMVNHHGGVVLVEGKIYGYSDGKGLVCQDFKTGDLVWNERSKANKGAVTYADGMLYCREENNGDVLLVAASPSGFSEKGRLKQPERASEKAWAHPSISGGKLYLRDQDLLLCYEIKEASTPAAGRASGQ